MCLDIVSSEFTYVSECNDGFYGDKCQNSCSTHCKSHACNKTNGICPGCKDGFYGDMCHIPCDSNCKACQQANGVCTECNFGFYGYQCNDKCSSGCKTAKCVKSDGWCECKARHNQIEGTQCLSCPQNCLNSCNQNLYCDSCKVGYFGDNCNKPCSSNCKDDKCARKGSCTCKPEAAFTGCCPENCQGGCEDLFGCKECKPGYYGRYCNETCSNYCLTNNCDRLDGKCSCKQGYMGEKCTEGRKICNIVYTII